MRDRLSGKTAIVTGGTEGIGLATVHRFAAEGARIVVVARRRQPGADLMDELGRDRIQFLEGDVTQEKTASGAVAKAIAEFGALHILVNNAAVDWTGDLFEAELADFQRVIATNLVGAFLMLRAAGRAMRQAGGSIVNVTSRNAQIGVPTMSLYAASKGGLWSLTRAAAIEWAPLRIRVNAVAPGLTETPMARAWIEQQADPRAFKRGLEAQIPQRRLATPEEVAAAVLFLASDESSHITGTALPVDGGYTAK